MAKRLISERVRRRFILGKQGLWPGRRWRGKDGTASALQAVEAIQVDPVSVIAPSHDLNLWGRVEAYQPQELHCLAYEERKFFDYGGGLMIYPIEELPYWRVVMARSGLEKRWAEFAEKNPLLLDEVRQQLRDRGPLRNRDFEGKSVGHYRARKDTGVALYYLWLTGELMTHSRHGKERVYDFLENVAPLDLQWTAATEQTIEFFIHKEISQLGLVNDRDMRRVLRLATGRSIDAAEAKLKRDQMLEAKQLAIVQIEDQRKPYYILSPDLPDLDDLANGKSPLTWHPITTTTSDEVIFLSPLDYVSARGRAKELFGFTYIWEIYKPATKRQYGPYTMPILYGDQLVARIDAKCERQTKTLQVNGFWLEDWFAPDQAFALALAKGLLRFMHFLDMKRLICVPLNPTALREDTIRYLQANDLVCES
ncbi:MAG: crosslink repair DNA glycosylase YcaQ family protein [Chloroflexota bacterium]